MEMNGTVRIETKIRRKDGSVETDETEYEVINGVVQDGNTSR